MQFGRIDGNAYTLDFQYPFSALQAFAVALANVTQRLKWTPGLVKSRFSLLNETQLYVRIFKVQFCDRGTTVPQEVEGALGLIYTGRFTPTACWSLG